MRGGEVLNVHDNVIRKNCMVRYYHTENGPAAQTINKSYFPQRHFYNRCITIAIIITEWSLNTLRTMYRETFKYLNLTVTLIVRANRNRERLPRRFTA